jgi:hypothetical protein
LKVGGLRRDSGGESESLAPGITEAELLAAWVGPDLDSTTALTCLKELREQCLYLRFDGARYAFKKDPNVTLLVDEPGFLSYKIRPLCPISADGLHSSLVVYPPSVNQSRNINCPAAR